MTEVPFEKSAFAKWIESLPSEHAINRPLQTALEPARGRNRFTLEVYYAVDSRKPIIYAYDEATKRPLVLTKGLTGENRVTERRINTKLSLEEFLEKVETDIRDGSVEAYARVENASGQYHMQVYTQGVLMSKVLNAITRTDAAYRIQQRKQKDTAEKKKVPTPVKPIGAAEQFIEGRTIGTYGGVDKACMEAFFTPKTALQVFYEPVSGRYVIAAYDAQNDRAFEAASIGRSARQIDELILTGHESRESARLFMDALEPHLTAAGYQRPAIREHALEKARGTTYQEISVAGNPGVETIVTDTIKALEQKHGGFRRPAAQEPTA